MINPFAIWSRLFNAGLEMERNWRKLAEMLVASASVITVRSGTLRDAAQAPMTADYPEILRMVTEKMTGFTKSGLAVVGMQVQMQTALWKQLWRMAALVSKGGVLTPAGLSRLVAMTNASALDALGASAGMGTAALAPLHKTVTANARRLTGKK